MLNFVLFLSALIILFSLWSARNFLSINEIFQNLRFFKFHTINNMKIANDRTKDEFVIVSDSYFRINEDFVINFDIWTIIDLHKLYWYLRFKKELKRMGVI